MGKSVILIELIIIHILRKETPNEMGIFYRTIINAYYNKNCDFPM